MPAADSPTVKTLTGPIACAAAAISLSWRKAELGTLNGHANARSVARTLSAISLGGGEVDGVRLLSQRTIDMIIQEQANGVDMVLGVPLRFGIGYALPSPESTPPFLPKNAPRICIWGGWGGSLAVMDCDRRMTVSYMMNRMGPSVFGSDRSDARVRATYGALASLLHLVRVGFRGFSAVSRDYWTWVLMKI
ncbi:hypothetical protein AJ79_03713 [Helicocarpus griseus UAMH5409]|uniref:Beta-lactamase-related domain-containing protein n=1 Tax=Helicocarpus griseus UAMH5409 TaxID=1447875 RepID=A0A2B7XWH8_9EURO|nr:hypothetical protein AJ79_03713 [Helicocarpus griseus UAMH5409]